MQPFSRSQLPAVILLCLLSGAAGSLVTAALLRAPAAAPVVTVVPAPALPGTTQPERTSNGGQDGAALAGEADLPAELVGTHSGTAGLRFGVRRSRIQRYPDNAFYTLHAALTNGYVAEIRKIRLVFEGLDAQGSVVVSKAFDALSEHEAALRPGDSHVFARLEPVPAAMVACRLKVDLLDQDIAALEYPPARLLELEWPIEQPLNPPVEVRERSHSVQELKLSDEVFVDGVLEVRNASTGALRTVELEQRFFAADGSLLEKKSFLVVYSGTAPMLPGEVRLKRRPFTMPETYARYTIGVLKSE